MLELPPEFIRTIQKGYGDKGKSWLESFPDLFDEAVRRWDLTEIRLVPDLSYNFVAFAYRLPSPSGRGAGGEGEVILKLGVPNRELTSEIAALRYYAGRGACRLLDADVEKGLLLLERLEPGRMLATIEDDDLATQIGAGVMKNLWERSIDFTKRPVGVNRSGTTTTSPVVSAGEVITTSFIQLKDWFNGFQRLRQRFSGGTGPIPKGMVETAESLSGELLSENKDETLLHGDFHHFNVLESSRGWLAIDPKGVIGPRGYEAGPFLMNPVPAFLKGSRPEVQTQRRIAILSGRLGIEKERIRAWGLCHAVLSAWWSIEENDPGWGEYSLRCADIFRQVLD